MICDTLNGSCWMKVGGVLALGAAMMMGCASQQDKAIEAAKKQAAASGQPQQVVGTGHGASPARFRGVRVGTAYQGS